MVQSSHLKRLSDHFRTKRFAEVERLLQDIVAQNGSARVLDAGGRASYWHRLSPSLRPHVDLVVSNYSAELTEFDAEYEELQVTNVVSDACNMPEFEDNSFDLVHSNSVIEHVGGLMRMMAFASEVRRVGKAYYVQTPNFWFPVDPHYAFPFIHWFPDPVRVALFSSVSLGGATKVPFETAMERADYVRILDRRMMRKLFPDGRVINERILLLTKSITMVRDFPR